MAFYQWSKNAGSNSNSDLTINMEEGMPPAQLNDGGRAIMARLAEYRDDTAGSLLTAGSGSAYTVSTNQGFTSLAALHGMTLKVRFHVDCNGAPTLNADGQGSAPLLSALGYGIVQGAIRQGSIYDVTYDNTIPGFIITGGMVINQMPIGGVMDYAGASAPTLWVLCAGQAISRTTYAALFAVIGSTYGNGDGVTTFNVPDYRGRIGAGIDNMNGSAAGRIGTVVTDNGTIVGTTRGSTGGSSTHTQAGGEVGAHSHTGSGNVSDPQHSHVISPSVLNPGAGGTVAGGNAGITLVSATQLASTGITVPSLNINNNAAPTAMAWLQPTIMVNKIMFAGV